MFKKTILSKISLIVWIGINLLPMKVLAQSITFSKAVTSGSGCRPSKQIISPDGKSVSILLEKFVAENGKRTLCNLKIQANIPSGFHLQQIDVTYQGFRDIKEGETGFFKSSYLGSSTTGGVEANFSSGTDIFILQSPFLIESKTRSCKGTKTNIGINMTAFASKNSQVALDSVDLEAGKIILSFKLVPCE